MNNSCKNEDRSTWRIPKSSWKQSEDSLWRSGEECSLNYMHWWDRFNCPKLSKILQDKPISVSGHREIMCYLITSYLPTDRRNFPNTFRPRMTHVSKRGISQRQPSPKMTISLQDWMRKPICQPLHETSPTAIAAESVKRKTTIGYRNIPSTIDIPSALHRPPGSYDKRSPRQWRNPKESTPYCSETW